MKRVHRPHRLTEEQSYALVFCAQQSEPVSWTRFDHRTLASLVGRGYVRRQAAPVLSDRPSGLRGKTLPGAHIVITDKGRAAIARFVEAKGLTVLEPGRR